MKKQTMGSENTYWKNKFDELRRAIANLGEELERRRHPAPPPRGRELIQSRRLYINFVQEICDSKEYADDNWGEGNYDVYDLNKELSPFDQESEDYFNERTDG